MSILTSVEHAKASNMSTRPAFWDRIIPWYFVLFFVVLAVVNGVMVTLAVRSHTGIVTEHPYEKGLAYNKVVAASDQQAAMGWKGEIHFTQQTENSALLSFDLKDASGKRLVPERVRTVISRPTQAGLDFTATFSETPTLVEFPSPGLWEIRVFAEQDGVSYQESKRVVLK